MLADPTDVFVRVDTHADTHHVAVVDRLGRHLGDREFPADPSGYRSLLVWIGSFGSVARVGVEGTGTYGAQVGRVLTAAGLAVLEVNRPDRATRRANGTSDPVDAYAAAQAVASGRADSVPKSRDGIMESIRCLRVARRSAVKAKTQCINQIRGRLISGPMDLREQMKPRPSNAKSCKTTRAGPTKQHAAARYSAGWSATTPDDVTPTATMSAPRPTKGPSQPLRCTKPRNHNSRVHYVGARPRRTVACRGAGSPQRPYRTVVFR